MNKKKRCILMNAVKTSQFSHRPLVWISNSRTMNNRINKTPEKSFRLVYKVKRIPFFDDWLRKDKSVSIHQRNLQTLATEIYKVRNDLEPEFMKYVFHFVQKPCNLKKNRTVYFGTESISSPSPKI